MLWVGLQGPVGEGKPPTSILIFGRKSRCVVVVIDSCSVQRRGTLVRRVRLRSGSWFRGVDNKGSAIRSERLGRCTKCFV